MFEPSQFVAYRKVKTLLTRHLFLKIFSCWKEKVDYVWISWFCSFSLQKQQTRSSVIHARICIYDSRPSQLWSFQNLSVLTNEKQNIRKKNLRWVPWFSVRGKLHFVLFCKRSVFAKTFVLSGWVEQYDGTKHTFYTIANTCFRIWPCNVLFTVCIMQSTMAPLRHQSVSRPSALVDHSKSRLFIFHSQLARVVLTARV